MPRMNANKRECPICVPSRSSAANHVCSCCDNNHICRRSMSASSDSGTWASGDAQHSRRKCRSDRAEARLSDCVSRLCSPSIREKKLPATSDSVLRTSGLARGCGSNPDIHIVAELVGGTTVAREIIDAAIANGKSVVTANKELMALCGRRHLGPRHRRGHQPRDGSERGRRHPDSRRAARRHLRRSRHRRSTAS